MIGQKEALVDVCDVVVDLHRATIEILKLNLPTENIQTWDMFEVLSEYDCGRVKKLFNSQDFWRNLPPVENALAGVNGLKEQGYGIHWVTSPWFTCSNWETIRREWLNKHFDVHPLDITFTSHKYKVAGDILIDDRPKHIKSWQERWPEKEAWLFDSPFNRWFDWPRRCKWSEKGITKV